MKMIKQPIELGIYGVNAARIDCVSARDAWIRDDWGAMLQWIDSAQSNLKAARQKVEEHIAEEKG